MWFFCLNRQTRAAGPVKVLIIVMTVCISLAFGPPPPQAFFTSVMSFALAGRTVRQKGEVLENNMPLFSLLLILWEGF